MSKIDIDSSTEGVRFHHFHDADTGRLAATIATRDVEDGMVEVAASICSRRDQPDRKLGKMIALARLNKHKKTLVLSLADLKSAITNRTIISRFPAVDQYNLRPRKEFDPSRDRRAQKRVQETV